MITNSGLNLLSKQIAGQLPTFASHIAIGCGPNAVTTPAASGTYAIKTSMDMEMLRVPIISRAVRIIDGESYVAFTAELPSIDRYAITEIGVYPAEKSNIFGSVDSFSIASFEEDTWQTHNGSTTADVVLESELEISGSIAPASGNTVFAFNSDNALFTNATRLTKQEQPRFLNKAIAIRGDYSTYSGGLDYTAKHIHKATTNLAILDEANEVSDELRLGFSIANTSSLSSSNPTRISIAIDFCSDDPNAAAPTTYARWVLSPTVTSTTRYQVATTKLTALTQTSDFTWSKVNHIRIYSNIDSSTSYFLMLDSLRFENISAIDSQYSLAGYTTVVNTDAQPIIKEENNSSLIEYRFKVDVV